MALPSDPGTLLIHTTQSMNTKIYISGLPPQVDPDGIRQLLREAGVAAVPESGPEPEVVVKATPHHDAAYAFVDFGETNAASEAVNLLKGEIE